MAKYQGNIAIKNDSRCCYLCGGKVIWDSEELTHDGNGVYFEIYLHCTVCRAMIQYVIPIEDEGDELK